PGAPRRSRCGTGCRRAAPCRVSRRGRGCAARAPARGRSCRWRARGPRRRRPWRPRPGSARRAAPARRGIRGRDAAWVPPDGFEGFPGNIRRPRRFRPGPFSPAFAAPSARLLRFSGECPLLRGPPGRRRRRNPPLRMIFVIFPAYNEERVIRPTLLALANAMRGREAEYRAVLVDDGSRDRTVAEAESAVAESGRRLPLTLLRHEVNSGLGAGLRTGIYWCLDQAADADVIVTLDADNTHPPALIPALVARLE